MDERDGKRTWDQWLGHAEAWREAHRMGASAYRKWQEQNWPERDCASAAVAAGVIAYMDAFSAPRS